MRRAGFTLTELLIVIGIIMLLMGLLFPIIAMVRRQAQRTKCITLIHQIDAACDIYRNLNGAYPDTPASWPPPPSTDTRTMANIFTSGSGASLTIKHVDDTSIDWEGVSLMLLSAIKSVDRDHFATQTVLHDPWNQPLHYRPVQYYPYLPSTGTPAPKLVDQDPPPHPDGYQLWSSGYNELNEYGEANTDDVTNWK
jgi:type II secretory pathway pseudopilin PulG